MGLQMFMDAVGGRQVGDGCDGYDEQLCYREGAWKAFRTQFTQGLSQHLLEDLP